MYMRKEIQQSLLFFKGFVIIIIIATSFLSLDNASAQINSSSIHRSDIEGFTLRVAPGEELFFAVKLINFGVSKRSDVNIFYKIYNNDNAIVYSQNETVAVETTATFIRHPVLPRTLPIGNYTMVSYVAYPNQISPAISEFRFTVENKYFGIFISDLWWYILILLVSCIASAIVSHFMIEYVVHASRRHA